MNPYQRGACLLAMGGLLVLWGRAEAAMVRFEMPSYTATWGDALDRNILIEYDQGEPADLFRCGHEGKTRIHVAGNAGGFVGAWIPLFPSRGIMEDVPEVASAGVDGLFETEDD